MENTPFDIIEYIETASFTELQWAIKEMVKEISKNIPERWE